MERFTAIMFIATTVDLIQIRSKMIEPLGTKEKAACDFGSPRKPNIVPECRCGGIQTIDVVPAPASRVESALMSDRLKQRRFSRAVFSDEERDGAFQFDRL